MFRFTRSAALPALRNGLHTKKPIAFRSLPVMNFSAAPDKETEAAPAVEPAQTGGIGARFISTAEVTVSKLFPAGFGWQASSVVADGMGYGATDVPFFLITGTGDFVGVLAGHTSYYALKKAVTGNESISVGAEFNTGLWLASAAFCSGAAWQPIVNFWQGLEVPFNAVVMGTWAGCGFMFFAGLRLGRVIYPFMEDNNYENLKTDSALSASIGGATACFVGTDVAYMGGDGNWLRPVIGVEDADSDLLGCIKAGSSTALGFAVAQSAQNLVYPAGKCWND